MWLLNKKIDILLLSYMGVFSWVYLTYTFGTYPSLFIFGMLFIMMVDFGHYYTMILRIKNEYKYMKKYYIIIPILSFTTLFLYQYFGFQYLWSIFMYLAFYHFIKQYDGIILAYLKGRKDKFLNLLVYLLSIIPIVGYHFKVGSEGLVFAIDDNVLYLYPNQELFIYTIVFNILLIIIWVIYEFKLFLFNNLEELGRILFILSNIITINLVFFFTDNIFIMIMVLLFSHGVQYYVLNYYILVNVYKFEFKNIYKWLIVIPFIVGIFEIYIKDIYEVELYSMNDNISYLIISLLWTIPLSHFIFDHRIWKGKYLRELSIKIK